MSAGRASRRAADGPCRPRSHCDFGAEPSVRAGRLAKSELHLDRPLDGIDSRRSSVQRYRPNRLFAAVVIWSAIALLRAPSTVTSASLGKAGFPEDESGTT